MAHIAILWIDIFWHLVPSFGQPKAMGTHAASVPPKDWSHNMPASPITERAVLLDHNPLDAAVGAVAMGCAVLLAGAFLPQECAVWFVVALMCAAMLLGYVLHIRETKDKAARLTRDYKPDQAAKEQADPGNLKHNSER